jgi:hypothetical protein
VALSLITEVVAFLPGSDLTTSERLVLFAIADQANADTRMAYQSTGRKRWVLAEVVGLSATGLRDAFQRLAKRHLEVRVAFGKDSSGRVLYAVYGRQTTYWLPYLTDRVGDGQASPRGDDRPSGRGDGGALPGDGQAPPADGGLSPFSSAARKPLKSSSSELRQLVMQHTDAKPGEADAVVARIVNERNPQRLGGFIAHLAKTGELQDWVNQVRAARIKADREQADVADRKVRQGMRPCDHGMTGGDQPHSFTGEIRCNNCRQARQFSERRTP